MSGTESEREQRDRQIYLLYRSGKNKTEISRTVGLERKQVTRIISRKQQEQEADETLVKSRAQVSDELPTKERAVKIIAHFRKVAAAQQRLVSQRPGLRPTPAMRSLLHTKMMDLDLDSLEQILIELFEHRERT